MGGKKQIFQCILLLNARDEHLKRAKDCVYLKGISLIYTAYQNFHIKGNECLAIDQQEEKNLKKQKRKASKDLAVVEAKTLQVSNADSKDDLVFVRNTRSRKINGAKLKLQEENDVFLNA
jgi:hypothetical protein